MRRDKQKYENEEKARKVQVLKVDVERKHERNGK